MFIRSDLGVVRGNNVSESVKQLSSDVEIQTFFSTWLLHEFSHHLFNRAYPEFELEKESHQWFDKQNWPDDFEGVYQPDYFIEALQKRIVPRGKPLHEELNYSER